MAKQTKKGTVPEIAGRKRPGDSDIQASVERNNGSYSKVVADLRSKGFPLSHWFRAEFDRVVKASGFTPPAKATPKKASAKKATAVRKSTPTMAHPTGNPNGRTDVAQAAENLKNADRYRGAHKITITDENVAQLAGMTVTEIVALPDEVPTATPITKENQTRRPRKPISARRGSKATATRKAS
jgi:hypothetical protein